MADVGAFNPDVGRFEFSNVQIPKHDKICRACDSLPLHDDLDDRTKLICHRCNKRFSKYEMNWVYHTERRGRPAKTEEEKAATKAAWREDNKERNRAKDKARALGKQKVKARERLKGKEREEAIAAHEALNKPRKPRKAKPKKTTEKAK